MARQYTRGVPSTAAIGGHPIHPMLIPFPIALLTAALATDVTYWVVGDPFWAQMSFWLVGGGLVTGAGAAIFGLVDFLTISRARERIDGWVHLIGNGVALAIAFVSLLLRFADPAAVVLPLGLTLSAVTFVILLVTGWYGGELAYRYMIGVTGASGEAEATDQRRRAA